MGQDQHDHRDLCGQWADYGDCGDAVTCDQPAGHAGEHEGTVHVDIPRPTPTGRAPGARRYTPGVGRLRWLVG